MTKQKHFISTVHTALNRSSSHGACSSLLEPNCRKGPVAHQKACSGKAFRPQDHTLAVTTCLSAQAICHLPPLSPVFIWRLVCFSLNGTGATWVDLLAPSSWSPLSSASPHPCSHKRSRKKPNQPNKSTWERQGDSYWWNILALWLPGTGICSSWRPSLNVAASADIQWDFALWFFWCFSLFFGWLLNVFASPIFVSSV